MQVYSNMIDYQIYLTKPLTPFSASYTYYKNGKSFVQAINNTTASMEADFTAPSGQKIKLSAQITEFPAGDTPVVQIYVNQQLVATSDSTHTATFILN